MPKSLKSLPKHRHNLYSQLESDVHVPLKGSKSIQKQKSIQESTDFVDSKTSKKILNLVQQQQQEEWKENNLGNPKEISAFASPMQGSLQRPSVHKRQEDEESDWEFENMDTMDVMDDLEIDDKDAELMEKFMKPNQVTQQSLSDLIMSKIEKHQEDGEAEEHSSEMDPKIVQVFTKVGSILSRYRSGPVPKAFKIIPSLKNWEDVLFLTAPHEWSPQAVFQATRIFVSNLNDKSAQRFFTMILLDRVREDIKETKKLNVHLYNSLKKGLYKTAAFFKGFLFPLLEMGNATLREAAIIGSVLTKVSIPVLHSAAALLKIAEMEYTGPNSLFIRILLDKKYALPFKVVDGLVFHFIRFKKDSRELPVLWHQSLLVFAQRYKEDITPEQKEAILDLIKAKSHPDITPEIRRELVQSKCRGEMMQEVDSMEMEF